MTRDAAGQVLTVDMVRCAGHGICALVHPDGISLDEWGFPVVDPTPSTDAGRGRAAVRAARACPRRALSVMSIPAAQVAPTVAS